MTSGTEPAKAPPVQPALIPVPTRILTPDDDLTEVLKQQLKGRTRPGDVVAVASKVVSITQGRILRPADVKPGPGLVAHVVSRFINQEGSLSSPYSLQAVINEEGTLRVALAFLVGSVSRVLFRRQGDFYRLAGYLARIIDDVSGNLPPFDKHIVLAPDRPGKVVHDIKKALGVDAAIIDANDLGLAEVVAATDGVDEGELLEVFRRNPWGNTDQQIPIMLVRKPAFR